MCFITRWRHSWRLDTTALLNTFYYCCLANNATSHLPRCHHLGRSIRNAWDIFWHTILQFSECCCTLIYKIYRGMANVHQHKITLKEKYWSHLSTGYIRESFHYHYWLSTLLFSVHTNSFLRYLNMQERSPGLFFATCGLYGCIGPRGGPSSCKSSLN